MRTAIWITSALLFAALAAWSPRSHQAVAVSASAPSAELAVPVGAVLLWWGIEREIPAGFEVCDGTLPLTKDALLKLRKPDLRGRFPKGVREPSGFRPESAASGGSNSLGAQSTDRHVLTPDQIPAHAHAIAHVHDLAPHAHATPTHDHPIGNHTHPIGDWTQTALPGGNTDQVLTTGSQATSQAAASGTTGSSGAAQTQAGGGGPSGPANPAQSGANASAQSGHSHSLGGRDNQPAFLELLFIVRVR